ncbi:DUF397 domain-containing protein [Plantactinospora sp. WMMB334]
MTAAGLPVRDSQDPHGPILTFTPLPWRRFVDAVQSQLRR